MCDKYSEDKILDFLMGELSPEDRGAFDAHCEECSSCRAAREEIASLAGLSGARRIRPRPGAESRVRDAIARISTGQKEGVSAGSQGRATVGGRLRALFSGDRLRWLAVAASVAIVVSSVSLNYYRSRHLAEVIVAHVEKTSPEVYVRRGDRSVVAVIGMPLWTGDQIETQPDQKISFTYPGEKTRVGLDEKTTVRLEPRGKGKRLLLHRGRIEAAVAPQPEGKPMAVITPHAELAVLGTEFSVTASEDITGLAVKEGTVRMEIPGGGHHADVGRGQVGIAKAGADRVVMPGKLVRSMRITGLPEDAVITGIAVAGRDVWVYGSRGEDGAPILACLDPATGRIVKEARIGEGFRPGSGITWKGGLLWGFSRDDRSLQGIDVETGAAARTIPLPAEGTSSLRIFDIEGNLVWTRGSTRNELVGIDIETGTVVRRFASPFAIDRIAASENAVYAGKSGWSTCRIDPGDGRIAYRFMCGAESVTGDMAIGADSRLWVTKGNEPVIHVFEAE